MTKTLFQLGDFQFHLKNGVPQALGWQAEYRWEQQDRLLRDPAQQFIGPGTQTITFDGVMYPGFSGRAKSIDKLRTMASKGKPVMLSDGTGKIYGRWVIQQVREGRGVFLDNGAARQIDFSVQIVFYGEDKPGLAASPLSVAAAIRAAGTAAGAAAFGAAGSAFAALDWSQALTFQALTQQATQSGFNLGQLASIASTGAGIASQISSGNYVGAALSTFGLAGIPIDQSSAWAQIGINAANLAQSYATGNGPTGMALALEAAAAVGAPTLAQSGIVSQQNLTAISSLLQSAATVSEILKVDPKVTASLQPLITLSGS